ncbi:MAG: hypothetical protein R3304_09570 [Longimicrobiales bacterium]|nr:hypothetical protein [Longimicrobiales bacterium]
MKGSSPFALLVINLGVLALGGCDVTEPASADGSDAQFAHGELPTPTTLVTVSGGGSTLELWPFTTFSPGAAPSDPINLLFPGVDIRSIRAALLMLDGDRTGMGYPATPPFDCTWKESMGANQASYATPVGWTGSAIQLECGDYDPIRFHIRMFPAGDWTIANAHFEVLISGTNQHEVLSWELAEQLIVADLARAGILAAAPALTAPITPAPTYRAINPLVFNGLPVGLQVLVAGQVGPVSDPVAMVNDGMATILTFARSPEGERMVARRSLVLEFDQTIPKPFCSTGPLDFLKVTGAIQFMQQVVVSAQGNFMTWFHARGGLELGPVNPVTGATGDPLMARVAERDRSVVTDQTTLVSTMQMQLILPRNRPESGRLFATLRLGPGDSDAASLEITCR